MRAHVRLVALGLAALGLIALRLVTLRLFAVRPVALRSIASLLIAAPLTLAFAQNGAAHSTPARNAAPPYSFAVVSGTIDSPADEPATQRLLEAIARERNLAFVVYAGNLKGPKEACRDPLYTQRAAILAASRVPLVFIPGHDDWITCGTVAGGSYDPVERLDFLRQTVLTDAAAPPRQDAMPVTRESEVARFRPYRENARWMHGDVVFAALDVPAPNNHYLIAGGRNGEFEDRVLANGFWIEHTAEYAKRRNARALVIFFEGDPQFDRYERAERFAWLRFNRSHPRDGFRELKRSLTKAAAIFRGPVVVVHASANALPDGFAIDRPLHADEGELVGNVTRIAIGPRQRTSQWIRVVVDPTQRALLGVGMQEVPKNLPAPPALPAVPRDETPMPSMPEIPAPPELPDSSSVAPPLPGDNPAPGGTSMPAPVSAPASGAPASMQRMP